MWPHESISTLGRFSTSLRGRDVKITSGFETGDRERGRKLVAHTRSIKQIQMLAVSQHDLVDDMNVGLLKPWRSRTRRQIVKDKLLD